MTVVAARLLQPVTSITHKVAEATKLGIECIPEKSQVSCGQFVEVFRRGIATKLVKELAKDEGPRVVVCAVAFAEVRHIKNRVLQDAGFVSHSHEVIEPKRRQIVRPARKGPFRKRAARAG